MTRHLPKPDTPPDHAAIDDVLADGIELDSECHLEVSHAPQLAHALTKEDPESDAQALGTDGDANETLSAFEPEDIELGREAQRFLQTHTYFVKFQTGRLAHRAHERFSKRGRNSLYRKWCDYFLPFIEFRSLERMRKAYLCFRDLLALDTANRDSVSYLNQHLQLTALYRLCQRDVTDAHRLAALAQAKEAKATVTKADVEKLINGKKGDTFEKPKTPAPPTTPPEKRKPEEVEGEETRDANHCVHVKGGWVNIHAEDGDYEDVLAAAYLAYCNPKEEAKK